jgi:hypothetical protein
MINRSLEAEMDVHQCDGKHAKSASDEARSNTRNGISRKTVKGDFGELEIETPRDREDSFGPPLVKKRQVRLAGREDKILTLYAKGLTTRDIEHTLQELYGVGISHTIISQVIEGALAAGKSIVPRRANSVISDERLCRDVGVRKLTPTVMTVGPPSDDERCFSIMERGRPARKEKP